MLKSLKKFINYIKSLFQKKEVKRFLKEALWEFLISMSKIIKRHCEKAQNSN